ncbi:EVE domain-containing protein [Tistlia consotensis]|uniref:EVE domain-containing protein n=1 Tax=Tistlia consotensis USBA 355 TaxID=560819 RepID=A0A1Y6B6Q1_9PROT|nr:P-loop NTPase fold protein [Tistlia consotensis]SME94884.1 EVE domain-containing protein [Tistlia consotensis USBA 355]SNR29611.1 EVE domain-containing protein [Tistlia consotensis]
MDAPDFDPDAPSHWIFQANHEKYDLASELKPGGTEGWLASRYATRMRPGDVVWLWQSGERAIHGWGRLVSPALRDPDDGRFWVQLQCEARFGEPLPLEAIRGEPDLAGLQILRAPQGTNFALTPSQAAALTRIAAARDLQAPEPPGTLERGAFVSASSSTPLLDLLGRARTRPLMLGALVQCVDLLAALFAEGQTTTAAAADEEPAVVWLRRALAPQLSSGGPEATAGPALSILESLPAREDLYDAGVDGETAGRAIERLGESFSAEAAAVVERAAQIQSATEVLTDGQSLPPPEQRPAFDYALVAALLFGDLRGVRALLAAERLSLAALREAFLAQVERVFGAGAAARWRRFTRLPGAGQALANFSADRPEGEDALEIEPDVKAFASVIAARAVKPPLSIGLFGNWGSGKSFFMNRLRGQIEALAASATRPAASDPAGLEENPDSPFWPKVVQIEFNAWHYVESNLWASLVAHLFNSLARIEEKAEAERTLRHETLLRQLNVAAEIEREAHDEERAARDQLAAAQWKLQIKRREVDETRVRLSLLDLLRAVPWEAVGERIEPELRRRAEQGDGAALAAIERQLREEVERSRTLAGRAAALLRATGQLDGRSRLLLAVLALAVLGAGLGLAWLLRSVDWQPVLAGGLALLATGLAWWQRVQGMADRALSLLERSQLRLERVVAARPEERQAAALRRELADLEVELANAEVQSRQAAGRVERAEAALREFRTTSSVAHFIEERAGSGDYRGQLGLLALIRNDFEELSRRLRRARGEADEPALPLADPGRIDRIVLYIDDLDRCPPERVFEVLQAIHLLLAFDLFVVVVGVDERWLSRALAMARAGLLAGSGTERLKLLQSLGVETADTADPADFLEKIFQIPFWLRPIDKNAFGRLVDELVAGDLPPVAGEDRTDDAAPGTEGTVTPGPASGAALGGRAVGLEDEVEAEAETIFIEPFERDCMRDLSAVVGRSPRTAKAFVNIWRILKSRESIGRALAPLRREESCGGLLLLALVVGHPHGAEAILDLVQSANPATPVGDLFPQPEEGAMDKRPGALKEAGVSQALYREIARVTRTHLGSELTAAALQHWLPTVRRFSFSAAVARDPAYLDLFRRAGTGAEAQT